MPKEPETNSTAEETAELDAEFERQLAATLAMDPVERVKRNDERATGEGPRKPLLVRGGEPSEQQCSEEH